MDLISTLDKKVWQNIDSGKLSDMKHYTIIRTDRGGVAGSYKYAVKEVKNDGELALVSLDGGVGKVDPLNQIRNVDLQIIDNKITAINVDGDAVVRKT